MNKAFLFCGKKKAFLFEELKNQAAKLHYDKPTRGHHLHNDHLYNALRTGGSE